MSNAFSSAITSHLRGLSDTETGSSSSNWNGLPFEVWIVGCILFGVAIGLLIPMIKKPFRRFKTANDIPAAYFDQGKWIKVKVVSITDGDTFRARHCPPLRGPGKYEGRLSENTLSIRIAGIDTPETAKFGNEAQPFAEDAKEFLRELIDGQTISIQLLRKDQYSRAVCMVYYGKWPMLTNVSEEILKEGLGYIYRQGGAEYGGDAQFEIFERLETEAKKKKLNVWSKKNRETASEYKARTRGKNKK